MQNKVLVGILALASVAAVVGVTSSVSAFQGRQGSGNPAIAQGSQYSQERFDVMNQAFENKDYNAWKNLMGGRGRASTAITEENFPKMAEMHKLMLEGKIDEANAIRTELGLGQGRGGRGGGGCPMADGLAR